MKYLSDYTQQAQTELFKKTGAFFAFSNKQFGENQPKPNTPLHSLGAGMYCPQSTSNELVDGLRNINSEGVKQDIAENGIDKIIMRELGNYETQLTDDVSDTVDALEDYGVTRDEVQKVYGEEYYPYCVENDLF